MNFSQLHERLRIEMLRRIDRGSLTAAMLARQAGLVPAHISNFLNCKRMLSLKALDRVMKEQHLELSDLLGEVERSFRDAIRRPAGLRYDSVPLVTQSTAIHDSHIPSSAILDAVKIRRGLLENLREKCPARRRNWDRFVAVQITAQQSEPMRPILPSKGILLIDRHYVSAIPYSAERRTVFAARHGNLLRFRYVELTRTHLVLRPHSRSHAVELLDLSPAQTSADLLVGRVFLSIAEI